LIKEKSVAYRSSVEYFEIMNNFISELCDNGKTEASRRMKECYDYLFEFENGWKLFYRKLLLMKEEFELKLSRNENKVLDDIIEGAKRVVCSM